MPCLNMRHRRKGRLTLLEKKVLATSGGIYLNAYRTHLVTRYSNGDASRAKAGTRDAGSHSQ